MTEENKPKQESNATEITDADLQHVVGGSPVQQTVTDKAKTTDKVIQSYIEG
jgi:hypothetical protein